MVVSASRTTQSAGSASRSAPGSGGRAGAALAVFAWLTAGASGACAQAKAGSSATRAARNIFFIAGLLLINPLYPQAAAFEHRLHRDSPRQMAGADREQDGARPVEPPGQPVREAAVAAGDQALVKLGRQRLHLGGDAVQIAADPVAL